MVEIDLYEIAIIHKFGIIMRMFLYVVALSVCMFWVSKHDLCNECAIMNATFDIINSNA